LAPHLAYLGDQPGLDGHVDVFLPRLERELPRLDLGRDLFQAPDNLLGLRRGDDPLAAQHPGMGHRAGDILAIKALIEAERGGEVFHALLSFPGEPPAPGFLRHGPTPFKKIYQKLPKKSGVADLPEIRWRHPWK